MARAASPAPVPPLFRWRADAETARLESERRDLQRRILALPRYSHRRLVLEARLADLTARQLALETEARS